MREKTQRAIALTAVEVVTCRLTNPGDWAPTRPEIGPGVGGSGGGTLALLVRTKIMLVRNGRTKQHQPKFGINSCLRARRHTRLAQSELDVVLAPTIPHMSKCCRANSVCVLQ